MNFYLISPRVDGQSTEIFVNTMFEQNIVMMGWGTDSAIGSDFSNKIENGDFVLVAQRVNWEFTYYFAGVVAGESFVVENRFQCRKVSPFIDLRNSNADYLEGASFAEMNPLKALTPINPNKNELIIRRLKEILNNYNNQVQMKKYVDLLLSKKNIILQGAPGTGKTYSTAAIALSVLGIDGIDLGNHEEVMKKYSELQDNQIFFTTFHQSLDYEDFVEGLKPRVQTDENGESLGVIYEPEDGIFKRACNAVETDDSKDIVECIDDYLQKIKGFENKRKIPTVTGKSSLYVWWNDGNKTVSSRSTKSTSQREEDYSPSPLNIEKIKSQALGKGCENNWQQYAQAFIEAVKKEEYTTRADKPVVLIIDEINRGNVSKIFGELITLLEADKREGGNHPLKVTLPYSKTLFGVPSNLYIIGTMNTTDRSTGTLDYALRRRFAFVTLESKREVIENHYDTLGDEDLKNQALTVFDDIKDFIEKKKHGDFSIDDLMVGHSYFMASNRDELIDKIEYEVLPLITEYINDGILAVTDDEKKSFEKWRNLQPIAPKADSSDNSEENE